MRVECPRCGKTLYAYAGEESVLCDCHLYCDSGSKPSDCTLVDHASGAVDPWLGLWNYPQGMHLNQLHDGQDTQARVKYCTTHGKYVDKLGLLVTCNWENWHGRRAKEKLRWHKGVI